MNTHTDELTLGSTPPDESCAQVGSPSYERVSRAECAAWAAMLERTLGPIPPGARLTTRCFQHDFGSYREVVVVYDTRDAAAVDFAMRCEGECPTEWDAQAKRELEELLRGER